MATKELAQLSELARAGKNDRILAKLVAARDKIKRLREEYERLQTQFERRKVAKCHLPLLAADYCLYRRYPQTALALQSEYGLEGLLDLDLYRELGTIEGSVLDGNLEEVSGWCASNRAALKKSSSRLEYTLRKQQYLLLAQRDRLAAIAYSRKTLGKYAQYGELGHLAMALVIPQPPLEWAVLACMFRETFMDLHGKQRPQLFGVACAGLAALKTRQCKQDPQSECPACSMRLAQHVPYARHSMSRLEEHMVMLPSRRCVGYEQLRRTSDAMGVYEPEVCDPKTQEIYRESDLVRVYSM